MKVSMIGIGKLGLPCAEVMSRFHEVVGYDVSPRKAEGFTIAPSLKEAVEGAKYVFVSVQTPHEKEYDGSRPSSHLPNKDFSYATVVSVFGDLAPLLKPDQIVVLISTVLPGTTRSQLKKYLPNNSLIYNPYLIAMATVKADFVEPEMIIIGNESGQEDEEIKDLKNFYSAMMKSAPRFETGTWEEAESIKIFYNTFISAKLSLVNMIQDVAEKNGHINVDVVTQALGRSTHRIMSTKYMTAGLGDGGPCHPRDNIALRHLAERLDLGYDLFDAIMRAREVQSENLAKAIVQYNKPIVILGKAYTRGVSLTDGSPSVLVGHYIEQMGQKVSYYDPHTGDTELPETSEACVYMIGYWDDFIDQVPLNRDSFVFDPWRRFKTDREDLTVVHYGNTRAK